MEKKKNDYFELHAHTTDIIDRSLEQQVTVYTIKISTKDGVGDMRQDFKLFDFKYVPIINLEVRKELINFYSNYTIITKLLDNLNSRYYFLFESCVKNFIERKKSVRNIDTFYDNEIKFFQSKKFDNDAYSVLKGIDDTSINKKNLYLNIQGLMNRAIENNINDINYLINGENKFLQVVTKPIKECDNLFESLTNNLYFNFIDFLKEQQVRIDLELKDVKLSTNKENKEIDYNSQIFTSLNSFLFFKELLKEFEEEIKKHPLAYLSFIYWNMKADKYLHNVSPRVFIDFLAKSTYEIVLDKIKVLSACNTSSKKKGYSTCQKLYPQP